MDDRQLVVRVVSGPERGKTFFVGGATIVGRGSECDIVLDSSCVSRAHLRLTPEPSGNVKLEDLESSNGTYVGGGRVRFHMLGPNQSFVVGDVRMFLAYATAEELVEMEARATQPDSVIRYATDRDQQTLPVAPDSSKPGMSLDAPPSASRRPGKDS